MKKIIFFLPVLVGGGAERTIINLANGLDKSKFDVSILLIDKPSTGKYKDVYSNQIHNDVNVISLGIKISKFNYPKIVISLGKAIRKLKPNIVFSTMLKSNILIFFALKLFHIKSKLVLRESTNRSVYHYRIIEKGIFKLVYNKADKIIALSQGVCTDLIEKFKIRSNNISVIYNPVDIDAVNTKKEKIGIKLDDSLPTIISVGRLIEAKDYHTLLMAYSELKKNMDFHAYILGKGELYDIIKDEIETLGLEKMVTLLGFNENPYAIMGQANLFVLSSKWEGFGNVIIEAMALGLPIITTDCNYGPREIITNNTNGVLVEVGNYQELSRQIFNILNSSDFSKKLSRNATIRAKDFSSEKIIEQYEKMLLSL